MSSKDDMFFCHSKATCHFLLKSTASNQAKWHVVFLKRLKLIPTHTTCRFAKNFKRHVVFLQMIEAIPASNDMSFLPNNKITCRFSVVFNLELGRFDSFSTWFQPDFRPNSFSTLWTPNSIIQNLEILEIHFPNDFYIILF